MSRRPRHYLPQRYAYSVTGWPAGRRLVAEGSGALSKNEKGGPQPASKRFDPETWTISALRAAV